LPSCITRAEFITPRVVIGRRTLISRGHDRTEPEVREHGHSRDWHVNPFADGVFFSGPHRNATGTARIAAPTSSGQELTRGADVVRDAMAKYIITLMIEAAKQDSVKKKLKAAFGEEIPIHSVQKLKTQESRADRLSEAGGLVRQASDIVEELKNEMDHWYKSIPENLQDGEKASKIEQARDELGSLHSQLEALDFDNVSFPKMF
jgi:hypothetical protein